MTKPRPEAIKGSALNWQHNTGLTSVTEPSANPNQKQTTAPMGNDDYAESAQIVATIGGVWNSRRSKQIAKTHGLNENYIHAAQEIRNRKLAEKLKKPLPIRTDPRQTAQLHAQAKPNPRIWEDLAELMHDSEALNLYKETLKSIAPIIGRKFARHLELCEIIINETCLYDLRLVNKKRATDHAVITLAHHLAEIDNAYQKAHQEQTKANKQEKNAQTARHGHKPNEQEQLDNWGKLRVEICNLQLPHTGRQGRKRITTNTGKNPSRIANYYTDPMRRVFTRQTKANSALVIVDASGSMSLTENQLDQIMNAAKGSTVVAYCEPRRGASNCWLVAHKNQRTRDLPQFGGNNAVDLPATLWAIQKYRRNRRMPVIWISDGYATGTNDATQKNLREQMKKVMRAHNIHKSNTITEALKDLGKLDRGIKLKCNPEEVPND